MNNHAMSDVYARVTDIKNMIEYMMDEGKTLPASQCKELYYKLGQAKYIIIGDRRANDRTK